MQTFELEYPGHGGRPTPATLYRPTGEGPFPAVIELAGGGWVSGDRSNNAPVNAVLAEAGVLVLAIDVRRPPAEGHPEAIGDVLAAVRWFKNQAPRFNFDPDRLGGFGSSSGGHQLMLAALRHADPAYGGCSEADLAFLALLWPVLDPLARYQMARDRGMTQLVASHEAYWPDEAAMAHGSPQRIVESGEAQALPPVLIVQGGADDNVPLSMPLRYADAYCRAGGRVELLLLPGEPHSLLRRRPDSSAAATTLRTLAAFIREHAETSVEGEGCAYVPPA